MAPHAGLAGEFLSVDEHIEESATFSVLYCLEICRWRIGRSSGGRKWPEGQTRMV